MAVQSFPTLLPNETAPDYSAIADWLQNSPNSILNSPPSTAASYGMSPLWNAAGGLNVLSDPGAAYDPSMVYRFDTGNQIGVPDGNGGFTYRNAAPTVFQPGQTYTLTKPQSTDVLGTATTPEEMQALVDLASKTGSSGWDLYQGDVTPGAQLFGRAPKDNTLLYAALAAAAAMGGGALLGVGAAPAATTAATGALPAGTVANLMATYGPIAGSSGVSAGLASGALTAGMTASELAALGSTLGEVAAPAATVAATEAPIVVSGAPAAASHLPAWAEAFAAPAISSGVTASMLADAAATQPAASPSLLDQVLKYGSLASLAANGVGGLLGGTGTGAGATTPYTPVLGPLPSFTRGTVQPFTGNYETYGQGPEWNFFAPQPTTGG